MTAKMESFHSLTLDGKGISVRVGGKPIKLGFSMKPRFLEIVYLTNHVSNI